WSGWVCVLGTLTCTRSDALGAGMSYPPITVTVDVAAGAPANVTNAAAVSVSGGGETNTANDAATDDASVLAPPDLALAMSHTGSFSPGQVGATYTLLVSNIGPGDTVGAVRVTDTPPVGLTATGLAGTGWTCTLGQLTCTRSDALAAGASYPAFTVTVTVAGNAPSTVTNTAVVSGTGDTTPANDTAVDATTITPPPDTTPPTAPTQLAASGITTSQLVIAWAPSSDAVGVAG